MLTVTNRLLFVFYFATLSVFSVPALCDERGPLNAPTMAAEAGFRKLIFSDNFAKDPLRSGNWFNNLWHERESAPSQLILRDDGLELNSYISLTTVPRRGEGGRRFHFGYFEARMRFPAERDNFPAFWLFSYMHAIDPMNRHWCELDAFEYFDPNTYVGTVHDWVNFKSTKNSNSYVKLPFNLNVEEWNVYGVLWQPDKISWFLNGKLIMSADTPEVCREQEMFLILSSQSHSNVQGQRLFVDWVRVWGD